MCVLFSPVPDADNSDAETIQVSHNGERKSNRIRQRRLSVKRKGIRFRERRRKVKTFRQHKTSRKRWGGSPEGSENRGVAGANDTQPDILTFNDGTVWPWTPVDDCVYRLLGQEQSLDARRR